MSVSSDSRDNSEMMPLELPNRISDYFVAFYNAFITGDVPALRNLYYHEWNDLTEMFYKETEWPQEEAVDMCISKLPAYEDNEGPVNDLFICLYLELYHRHVFLHGNPVVVHRFFSYDNYIKLFGLLYEVIQVGKSSTSREDEKINLPLEWLNDMFDEFLYQFEGFWAVRHELQKLDESELNDLKSYENAWDISQLMALLEQFSSLLGGNYKDGRSNFHSLPEKVGYIALLGFVRVHTLLSSYQFALDSLSEINLNNKRANFTRLNSMHITLVYFAGFALLMSKRYADCVALCQNFLNLHTGTSGMQNQASCFADSQFNRKCERIKFIVKLGRLLSIGTTVYTELHPQAKSAVDEIKISDIEAEFRKAAPNFINPAKPDLNGLQDRQTVMADVQLKWIIAEVKRPRPLPELRTILRLYSTISLDKLCKLANVTENELCEALLSMKLKAQQYVCDEDSSSSVQLENVAEFHFYIEDKTVYIEEKYKKKKFADFFLLNAIRLNQCVTDLGSQRRYRRQTHFRKNVTKN